MHQNSHQPRGRSEIYYSKPSGCTSVLMIYLIFSHISLYQVYGLLGSTNQKTVHSKVHHEDNLHLDLCIWQKNLSFPGDYTNDFGIPLVLCLYSELNYNFTTLCFCIDWYWI